MAGLVQQRLGQDRFSIILGSCKAPVAVRASSGRPALMRDSAGRVWHARTDKPTWSNAYLSVFQLFLALYFRRRNIIKEVAFLFLSISTHRNSSACMSLVHLELLNNWSEKGRDDPE
ncbi:hypothetical protein [Roseomonas sp. KE2513]|uniref:hypothetical protein n=1 Tax=Roseomonas sp. KE2513 TaxID=2479202 RepID=UPI0018E013BA